MPNEPEVGTERVKSRGHVGIGAHALENRQRPMMQQRENTRME